AEIFAPRQPRAVGRHWREDDSVAKHLEEQLAARLMIRAGAADDRADILPRAQDAVAQAHRFERIARLILNDDPGRVDAAIDQHGAHHLRLGRPVAADAARWQEADVAMAAPPCERAFDTPFEAAAGAAVGPHRGAEDHDIV